MSDATLTSPRGQIMLSYLPPYYQNSRVMALGVLQPEGMQFDALRGTLDDILNQFFAETATWAIDKWESELGIVSDPSKPLFQRRGRVISQLRGYGTATIGVITQIVKGYDPTALVAEDFAANTVLLMFPNGIDLNIDDMRATVRKLLPSHLTFLESFGTTIRMPVTAGKFARVTVSRSVYANNGGPNAQGYVLDGTWTMDGKRTLNSTWRAGPIPNIATTITLLVRPVEVEIASALAQLTSVRTSMMQPTSGHQAGIVVMRTIYANNGGPNATGKVLDGTWSLDGSQTLNGMWHKGPIPSSRQTVVTTLQPQNTPIGAAGKIISISRVSTSSTSAMDKANVTFSRPVPANNQPILNGTWLLDGTKTMNTRTYASAAVSINGVAV